MSEKSKFMLRAIELSIQSAKTKGGPFGCVIVKDNKIIAEGFNQVTENNDPTAHAEILVIKEATLKIKNKYLKDYNLYVTLEPCTMCASAIQNSRIKRLYFGCNDEKSGAVNSGAKIFNQKNCNHKPEIYDGIRASDCSVLIKNFFNEIRKKI